MRISITTTAVAIALTCLLCFAAYSVGAATQTHFTVVIERQPVTESVSQAALIEAQVAIPSNHARSIKK